jgi:hypothetical protein
MLLRPKSAIFTLLLFASSSRFSGFKSLCTTLLRWQYSTPAIIWFHPEQVSQATEMRKIIPEFHYPPLCLKMLGNVCCIEISSISIRRCFPLSSVTPCLASTCISMLYTLQDNTTPFLILEKQITQAVMRRWNLIMTNNPWRPCSGGSACIQPFCSIVAY